jgi:hypothetical protein
MLLLHCLLVFEVLGRGVSSINKKHEQEAFETH